VSNVSRSALKLRQPSIHRGSSPVVYFGTDQQVSEGFAIALRMMGLATDFLPDSGPLATNSSNTEDN
jgi:hypothetical protein